MVYHDNHIASTQDDISALEKAENELMQIERDMRSAEEVSFMFSLSLSLLKCILISCSLTMIFFKKTNYMFNLSFNYIGEGSL